MEIRESKVDFQVTGWVVNKRPENRFRRYLVGKMGEGFTKSLQSIAENCYSDDENKVMFLVDYYTPKYIDTILNGLIEVKLNGWEIDDNFTNTFVGLTKNRGKSWLYVVRGVEVMPREGHFLALGSAYNPKLDLPRNYTYGPPLEDKLNEARDNEAVIIASHPLTKLGLVSRFLLDKIIRDPSGPRLGLQEDSIRNFANYFDALESNSLSTTPEQTLEIERLAKEIGKPTVADSDGMIDTAFYMYNKFNSVDFSSPERMRIGIRRDLKDCKKVIGNYPSGGIGKIIDKAKHAALPIIAGRENY